MPVGSGNVPRGGYEADRNNFGPRAGFAWTLDDLERWVVRGGYGVYYNQGALATSEGLYFNPPYFNLNVYFPIPGLPPLTRAEPVSAELPGFHSPVGDGVSARSPDAVARTLERQRPASDRPGPRQSRSPMSRRAATT